jgi:molybdopterin-guanine dinucleotide biosynthesis protein B
MRVFGVIGWKNSGKTSLMERLVAEITGRGFTVSTVKHVHHAVDLDQPGKDTFRHRQAGATEVVLASADRFALMREHRGPEPDLRAILARLAPVDLVLVEGYKRDSHDKLEVWRRETGHQMIQPGDPLVRAVATDADVGAPGVPVLDLNDTAQVADFVLDQVGLARRPLFDRVLVADWSASATPATGPGPNTIWVGDAAGDAVQARHFATRRTAEAWITAEIAAARDAGRRMLVGFDFALGYPAGFAARLTGQASAPAVWRWLAEHVTDDATNANNRFAVAAAINARLGGAGPFWGVPADAASPALTVKKPPFPCAGLAEMRAPDTALKGAKSVWQLAGAGSVGSQSLTGLPVIHRLSQMTGVAVWPFDAPDRIATAPVVLAEVYPSLLREAVRAEVAQGWVPDAAQVRLLSRALWRLARSGRLGAMLDLPPDPHRAEEGAVLGAGHAASLAAALGGATGGATGGASGGAG